MGESLPRPRWWYERSQERREVLDVAVERLHAVLRYYPGYQKALVFGSYARGDVGPTSDLDVLVIVESTRYPDVLDMAVPALHFDEDDARLALKRAETAVAAVQTYLATRPDAAT